MKRLLGYELDESIGSSAADFIHPEDLEWAWPVFYRSLEEPGSTRRSSSGTGARMVPGAGSSRPLAASSTTRPWRVDLQLPGCVTERVRAEEELRRSEEQLARSNGELARSNTELEQFA